MAADRVLKTLAAAIFFFGAVTTAFAQQLDAAAPSAEPMPGFRDGDAGARKLRYRCAGEGEPTVLIEAGGATSFETLYSWERTLNFRPPLVDRDCRDWRRRRAYASTTAPDSAAAARRRCRAPAPMSPPTCARCCATRRSPLPSSASGIRSAVPTAASLPAAIQSWLPAWSSSTPAMRTSGRAFSAPDADDSPPRGSTFKPTRRCCARRRAWVTTALSTSSYDLTRVTHSPGMHAVSRLSA